MINGYKTLFGKPKGKRPLVIPRRIYIQEDNIKTDLKEIGLVVVD
jgi:hypothetical protein